VTEDLLEKMEEEGIDALDSNGESSEASGIKMPLKKVLGKKKKLIIICLTIVLMLSAVAGGWFLFFSGDDADSEIVAEQGEATGPEQQEEIVFEDIVILAPFERIPLKGESAMGHISLDIALELIDHQYRKQVYTVQDRLIRVVENKVRQMTWRELRSPEGKIRLKYELLRQMNSIFPKVTIRNIYFINFLMQ